MIVTKLIKKKCFISLPIKLLDKCCKMWFEYFLSLRFCVFEL